MVVAEQMMDLVTGSNIILFLGLVAVFVIGYKILQAIVDVFLIAITSGGFYAAMSYLGLAPELSVSQVLFFMTLGVALYLVFSSISAASKIISTVASFIWKIISSIGSMFKNLFGLFKGDGKKDSGGGSSISKKEKKIILDELDDD